ncbi:MAG: hypothetical protein L6R40_000812 [Gallowayella cf. fulva]|nr:MAG: hypothetical protein L6R40_000812 [Xanthomendoza cf. fulva]
MDANRSPNLALHKTVRPRNQNVLNRYGPQPDPETTNPVDNLRAAIMEVDHRNLATKRPDPTPSPSTTTSSTCLPSQLRHYNIETLTADLSNVYNPNISTPIYTIPPDPNLKPQPVHNGWMLDAVFLVVFIFAFVVLFLHLVSFQKAYRKLKARAYRRRVRVGGEEHELQSLRGYDGADEERGEREQYDNSGERESPEASSRALAHSTRGLAATTADAHRPYEGDSVSESTRADDMTIRADGENSNSEEQPMEPPPVYHPAPTFTEYHNSRRLRHSIRHWEGTDDN